MTILIEPDLGRVSGGLRYNRAVADAADGAIMRHALPGAWPDPSAQDDAALRHLAAQFDEPIIVDGLIGCSLKEPSIWQYRSSNSSTLPWPPLTRPH